MSPPATGHLVVDTPRGRRRYAIAARTQLDVEPPLLDWRTAPLAGVFFRHGAGESYELDLGAHATGAPRAAEGTVCERYLVQDGAPLVRDVAPAPAAGPRPLREALVVLDPVQQRAVDLPADVSLVVDGEAGVGKTLVALYRVAALDRRARALGRQFRPLVLVPTEGLRRLCRLLAERLGLARLEVGVLDEWLLDRARRAFPGLPKRVSETATAQVIALKRHPAVRAVLADFVDWRPPRGVEEDDRLGAVRLRLLHLFGDQPRLARVLEAAGGALPARAIAAVIQHTRRQFERTTEAQHRHVDAERLVALDGRALDAGTAMHDANTFDAEDVPVLFELARRGALRAGELPRYDHIVVDEAQLRAPLELAAIGDALAAGGTVTLAGDHRQASDDSAWFTGWDAARAELRRGRWSEITLSVTYRSVPAISGFARGVVEPAARQPLPAEPPADPAVWATPAPGALAQAALLCWHLDALIVRDPWRQICVLARTPEHARRLHAELSRGLDPTLVLDGDFRFEPGILVTTAAAVSGLEFDAVVIPDLSPAFYPDQPALGRSLYVAATRARDWLWLLTPEAWSPLVAAAPPLG